MHLVRYYSYYSCLCTFGPTIPTGFFNLFSCFLYLLYIVQVGMVDVDHYGGQTKYKICDTCRQYHSILNIPKPVFAEFDRYMYVYIYSTHSGAQISRFDFFGKQAMTTEPITSPLMHVHGVTTEAADFWFGLHADLAFY